MPGYPPSGISHLICQRSRPDRMASLCHPARQNRQLDPKYFSISTAIDLGHLGQPLMPPPPTPPSTVRKANCPDWARSKRQASSNCPAWARSKHKPLPIVRKANCPDWARLKQQAQNQQFKGRTVYESQIYKKSTQSARRQFESGTV